MKNKQSGTKPISVAFYAADPSALANQISFLREHNLSVIGPPLSDHRQLISLLQRKKVEVLLYYLGTNAGPMEHLIFEIINASPSVKMIVLAENRFLHLLEACINAGASAFCNSILMHDESILSTIKTVCNGETVIEVGKGFRPDVMENEVRAWG